MGKPQFKKNWSARTIKWLLFFISLWISQTSLPILSKSALERSDWDISKKKYEGFHHNFPQIRVPEQKSLLHSCWLLMCLCLLVSEFLLEAQVSSSLVNVLKYIWKFTLRFINQVFFFSSIHLYYVLSSVKADLALVENNLENCLKVRS
jgi:hypothetical protein